uniref:Uncharacterized protein n=1 Tax=Anopheles albimanus TaxID=7167 RepID=A0A182FDB9_ANOAL
KTPAVAAAPAASELEPDQAKKDEIECCNCALIQRKWDEDRARHTQETGRLSEQINYLQQQLALAGNVEMGLKQTMAEHQQRLEQKLHELSATVDIKQCLESPVIRAQRRKLKDTLNRLRDAEQRIANLVVDNDKKELLLQTQDTNIERIKRDLHAIREHSIRQIEYLDGTVDDTAPETAPAASHRQATVHNYPPSITSFLHTKSDIVAFDSRTSTPVVPATDDIFSPGTLQPATSQQAPDIGLDAASSFTSSGISIVPDESRMPSVTATAASDRDVTSPSASSGFGAMLWMNASMLTLCTASTSLWSPVPPEASVAMAHDNDDDDDDNHRHLIAELTGE